MIRITPLLNDLKAVLVRHFRPSAPRMSSEALLLHQIRSLQEQQRLLNSIREDLAVVAAELKDGEVFQELDRLAATISPVKGKACREDDDIMFR
ncbi:MAG: hypothetical protein A4E48_00073 [Methanosaeta sp. PtaU1.Bin060]|nr:MAG: hypothetical protein A4E45_02081 [Methanosaeta sp. PtaB.Bin039]OPY55384.1 MAG: hypothetical protein A4E48_00073 [Methanosaeta sp. PtaU1.Bin060]